MKSTICMLLAILTVMLCTAHAEINARGIWEMQSDIFPGWDSKSYNHWQRKSKRI